MEAARKGKVAEVRVLLEMAADPTLRNDQGLTALELARTAFGGRAPILFWWDWTSALRSDHPT